MSEVKQTTIRLPPEVHKALKIYAASTNRTVTKIILEAVQEKMKREEK